MSDLRLEKTTKTIVESKIVGEMPNILEFIVDKNFICGVLGSQYSFLLKMFYGMPLDNLKRDCFIKTHDGNRVRLSEVDMRYMYYMLKRLNTTVTDGIQFNSLSLMTGRQTGKSSLVTVITLYELLKTIVENSSNPLNGKPGQHYDFVYVSPNCESAETHNKLSRRVLQNMKTTLSLLGIKIVNQCVDRITFVDENDPKGFRFNLVFHGIGSSALRGLNAKTVVFDDAERMSQENLACWVDNLRPVLSNFKDHKIIFTSSDSTAPISQDSSYVKSLTIRLDV